jgi:hypothetical protein
VLGTIRGFKAEVWSVTRDEMLTLGFKEAKNRM